MNKVLYKDVPGAPLFCSTCGEVQVNADNGIYLGASGTDRNGSLLYVKFALCEHCLENFCDTHKLTVDYRHE